MLFCPDEGRRQGSYTPNPQTSNKKVKNMSNELTVYEKISDPIAAVTQLGEMFTRSGMFGCQKIEQGQVLALACISEKKSPFELVKTYHIIEGKLEMKSGAMLARFLEMGGKCIWKSDLQSTEEAAAYFEFGDNKGDFKYTSEDAKREGLRDRAVWKKSAPDMLRARLVSKVVRMFAPQINAGIYCSEEATGEEVIERELKLAPAPVEVTAPVPTIEVEAVATPVTQAWTEETPAEVVFDELSLLDRANKIVEEIGMERTIHYLRSRGKLSEDGVLADLPEAYLNNIVMMPEVFEKAIAQAEKGGK